MSASENAGPIVGYLEKMEAEQASDLFVTVGKPPGIRVYGNIRMLDEADTTEQAFEEFVDAHLPPGMMDRIKKERDVDVGISLSDTDRYRLNFFYQTGDLSMVVRRVPLGNLEFEELCLPTVLKDFSLAPRGLLLITGATGSGKSSTMAAILHHINQEQSKHIITIEDPIEFIHQDIKSVVTQREVGNDTVDFAAALRHVVRQSPDVVFIGEMRDMETIGTALSAAMTGHLVVSTMHTVDPVQTVERIIGYFPEGQRDQIALDFSLALVGVISERLLRRKNGEGLIPAFEVLVGTPLIRRAIARRQLDDVSDLLRAGITDGMVTFTRSLADLVRRDEIDMETAAAAATNREEFLLAVQGMETGIESLRRQGGEAGGDGRRANMRSLLRAAIKHNASDLILTIGSAPLLRINGDLTELDLARLGPHDTQRLIFGLLNPAQRVQFEANREIDFALSVNSFSDGEDQATELQGHRFRVNGFYQKGCVAGAVRVIPQEIPSAKELKLPDTIVNLANRENGLILVTGPTGSGKSTTQACLIDYINRKRPCHIITIEDPIEYVHQNRKAVVEQREVYADTTSFANALKYVLRQDPDVILIGEMRDPETISAALTAAETGHLVIATLHTNDCPQTVDRIIDSFPPHQQNQVRTQLASSLAAVVSQRLLPRADNRGRLACFEVMVANTPIQALIRDSRTHQIVSTMETFAKVGMVTMSKALRNLYDDRKITRETLERHMPSYDSA